MMCDAKCAVSFLNFLLFILIATDQRDFATVNCIWFYSILFHSMLLAILKATLQNYSVYSSKCYRLRFSVYTNISTEEIDDTVL